MLTKNIALMTAEIDAHRAADLLVQADYYDPNTGRGCFIGCLAHGNDTAVIADRFGLPDPLTRLLESIFERLPFDEAADFFSEIPRAIGRDGRDLTKVHWAFLADMLRHLPDTGARDVVADGVDLLAAGKDWPAALAAEAAEAALAALAAYWAAEAAEAAAASEAYWAAEAAEANVAAVVAAATAAAARAAKVRVAEVARAWSAAEAARAARAGAEETRRQRDAILRLIRQA